MILPLLMLFLFVMGPGIGLVVAPARREFGEVGSGILVAYAIHAAITLGVAYYMTRQARSQWKQSRYEPPPPMVVHGTVFFRGALALLIAATLVFSLGGYKVLFGGMTRGEVRTSLGMIGFAYAWTLKYFCPALLAYLAFHFKALEKGRKEKRAFVLCFLLAILTGLMTGTKFTTILIALPATSILIGGQGLRKVIGAALVGAVLVIGAAVVHEGRSLQAAAGYSAARATVVAAYGARCCWDAFGENPMGLKGFAEGATILGGAKIASAATGIPEDDVRFLKFSPPRYVTYLFYPKTDNAVEGTTNLTLTHFGEGVYFWGRRWFWVWSLFSGLLLGMTLNWYTRFYFNGQFTAAALVLTYYYCFLLIWISSGDWAVLAGLPTIVGFTMLRYALPAVTGERWSRTDPGGRSSSKGVKE